MKKQILMFSFMVAMISQVVAFEDKITFDDRFMFDETNEQSQWQYIERAFITKPAAEKTCAWKHLSAALNPSIAAFALYGYATSTANDVSFMQEMAKPKNVFSIIGTVSSAIAILQALECRLFTQTNRNTVENFFNNWNENQFYVPVELEEGFTLIAEAIEAEGQDFIIAHANEIVDTIQFHIMRHFEGRYKATLEIKGRDALADTKTTSEIVKIFTETAKNLTGSSK